MKKKIKMAFAALLLLAATIPVKGQTPSVEAKGVGDVLELKTRQGNVNWGEYNEGWITFAVHNLTGGVDVVTEIKQGGGEKVGITITPTAPLTWPNPSGNITVGSDTTFRLKIELNSPLTSGTHTDTLVFKQNSVEVGRVVVNLTYLEVTPSVTFTPAANSGFQYNYEDAATITLECSNASAVINYQLGNAGAWQLYSAPIDFGSEENVRLNARAVAPGLDTSETTYLIVNRTDKVKVTVSPEGSVFIGKINVSLESVPSDADIYYTLDGTTEPTESSTAYTPGSIIPVTASTKLQVKAFKTGDLPSSLTIANYTLKTPTPVSVPYFSGPILQSGLTEEAGYVYSSISGTAMIFDSAKLRFDAVDDYIILAFASEAGKLEFRTEGGASTNAVIRIDASVNGYEWHKVDTASVKTAMTVWSFTLPDTARYIRLYVDAYTGSSSNTRFGLGNIRLTVPNLPVTANVVPYPYTSYADYFGEYSGSFEDSLRVALNCATPGAEIYYTLDGSDPRTSEAKILYTDSIRLELSAVITAYATASGYEPSESNMVARYNRNDQLQQVEFTPAAQKFIGQISIALSNQSADAAIYYTLNGGVPTEDSTLYTTPILLTETATIHARAFEAGELPSNDNFGTWTRATLTPVTLPYFSGSITRSALTEANGYMYYGLGSDMGAADSARLRFDGKGDFIILAFDDTAATLSFKTKGNDEETDAVLGVYASVNGYDWNKVDSALVEGEEATVHSFPLPESARYIRLIVDAYNGSSSQRFGLGNIRLTEPEIPVEGLVLPITEDFSKFTQGSEENPVAISEIIHFENPGAGSYDIPATYTGIEGWRGMSIYQTGGAMRFGKDPWAGGGNAFMAWMSAPYFVHNKDKKIVVSLMARTTSSEQGIIKVMWQVKDSSLPKSHEFFLTGEWQTYTVDFNAYQSEVQITIQGMQDYCFMDNLIIGYEGEMPSVANDPVITDNGVKPLFFISDDKLFVKNVEIGSNIEIYNIAGQLMKQQVYNGGGINISNMNRGVYVVRTGNFSTKVVK
jgi:hypothetical protein